jgi:hypothetical protein
MQTYSMSVSERDFESGRKKEKTEEMIKKQKQNSLHIVFTLKILQK